jgi:predicted nucleic acid-binding protein
LTAYVLDASVAAKWVLPAKQEPLAKEAIHLLDRFAAGEINFSVPDVFWPETGNLLWKSVRAGRVSEQSALDGMNWLLDLGMTTSPARFLMADAVTIAVTLNRSVYDAVYMALAVVSGRHLLTADERLVNAAGSRFPIRWLGSVV